MWRILIIEDSPANMMLTADILETAGHQALQAKDANEGIKLARAEHPDTILLDMQLPDINGFEVTHILKSESDTKDIPLIALTACAMSGDKERMLAAGCDGYIEKPIRYKAFLAEIEEIMDRHMGRQDR